MPLGPDKKHLINPSVTYFLDFIKCLIYTIFGNFVMVEAGVSKSLVSILFKCVFLHFPNPSTIVEK